MEDDNVSVFGDTAQLELEPEHRSERRRRDDQKQSHRERRKRDREKHTRRHRSRDKRHDDYTRHHRLESPDSRPPTGLDDLPPWPARAHSAVELAESNLYVIDRRGDVKNVEYGSLHRYSVPAYRRAGYGNVLGLPLSMKIDRDASTEKEIGLGSSPRRDENNKRSSRLLSSKHGRLPHSRLRFIVPSSRESGCIELDYIELPSRKRKRGSESPDPESKHNSVDYRSIEGKAKASREPVDEDLELASDSDVGDASADYELLARQQNAMLMKQVKADPTNIHLWLALAEHQAKLVHPDKAVRSFTSSERRTLADLRLSVLDKATTRVSKDRADRDLLLLAIIDEGTFLWDSAKLASKWRDALADCPSSIQMWTNYIDFSQDNQGTFSFNRCSETYLQCLRMLQEEFSTITDELKHAVGDAQVYVLLRYTQFLREAGYDELWISIWQAILEYQHFMPASLADGSVDAKLSSLEEFWDSDAPRIGEESAHGWATFVENGPNDVRNPTKIITKTLFNSVEGAVEQEASHHGTLLFSTSPDDDHVRLDPFRYVMFADMREVMSLLVDMPKSVTVEAFLFSMGLPPSESIAAQSWCQDAHLSTSGFQRTSSRLNKRCVRQTVGALYNTDFKAFSSGTTFEDSGSSEYNTFIDRVLDALLKVETSNLLLAEYAIAFRLSVFPHRAAKTAKGLLKIHPGSLRLYNAYALVQYRLGAYDMAEEVWSTALRMRETLDMRQQHDTLILWHSRFHASVNQSTSPVDLILTISGIAKDIGSTRRLRATKELEGWLDRMELAEIPQNAVMCVDLLAWLAYLTTSWSLANALDTYEKYQSRMSSDLGTELLQQAKANLIKYHIERHPYRPTDVRTVVEESLRRFPSNSILLDLHANVASQDRLRMLVQGELQDRLSARMTVVEWSHRIADEIRRCDNEFSGSTSNAVRATFSKALLGSDSTVKHCPALWIAWLSWEHKQVPQVGEREGMMERVRQVLFHGLRHLPWFKYWVVLGVQLLHEVTDERELRQWFDVLMERGLRVRYEVA